MLTLYLEFGCTGVRVIKLFLIEMTSDMPLVSCYPEVYC